jgi:predicted ATP-grasp superfamily ATP-dependent carboligase
MSRVLVTDGEQRSTLAVVRSLGAAGFHVEVLSKTGVSIAGASRHCRAEHRVPDPSCAPGAFLDELGGLVSTRAADFLVPMTDVTVALVLANKEQLPQVVLPFPPPQVWAEATDKGRLMDIARELGVPVPRQVVVREGDSQVEACEWAAEVGYPVVLKPHRSAVVSARVVDSFGVKMAHDVGELSRLLAEFSPRAFPILVQERIRGPGLGGFFLASEGCTTAAFAHLRLREKPPSGGVSVLRESVQLREDIQKHSEALLKWFEWSGVAMIEFKEDSATGIPYLMEINGRFWGSLQLSIDSGVDFPRLLLAAFSVETNAKESVEPRPPADYQKGVGSRWLWGDFDHLIWILRAPRGYRRAHPHLPGRVRAVLRFLLPWRSRQHLEVLRVSDGGPFLRESLEWLRSVIR